MFTDENSPIVAHSLASKRNPGLKIGRITLNSPKTLNALTLEMIQSLTSLLHDWASDPFIACVFLEGAGEKAFCAGGDVQKLYKAILAGREADQNPLPACEEFFATEYRLDYLIHRYPKPIIAWGDGIIMGGGLGLFAGASHRVVTEKSLIAMPEITIGLYPDVGASYFLHQMPGKSGLFLALTGARMNAADALYGKLADIKIRREKKSEIIDELRNVHFEAKGDAFDRVSEVLQRAQDIPETSRLEKYQDLIDESLQGEKARPTIESFLNRDFGEDHPFLRDAQTALRRGSPTSMAIIFEQLKRSKAMSLEEAFRQELTMSLQCCLHHDFSEGVRALLIDKDQNPKWSPSSLAEVTDDHVKAHFHSLWEDDKHPLINLRG